MPARKKAIVTPIGDREFSVVRVFDAPRDLAFAVYTDPKLIPEWWGRRHSTTVVDHMDVRAGGGFRFVVTNRDGSVTAFRGTYREVTPPERIVQTFEWEGMPGHVSVETATFEDLGEQTRVTSVSIFHTMEERDGWLKSGMEEGMNELFDQLDDVLARHLAGEVRGGVPPCEPSALSRDLAPG